MVESERPIWSRTKNEPNFLTLRRREWLQMLGRIFLELSLSIDVLQVYRTYKLIRMPQLADGVSHRNLRGICASRCTKANFIVMARGEGGHDWRQSQSPHFHCW